MNARTVDISLDLGLVEEFAVVSAVLTEEISELTRATIEIATRKDLDLDDILEKDAVLRVMVDDQPARQWTLQVGSARFIDVKDGSLRYTINAHAHFWLLGHTLDTRKFRNLSAHQIVSDVLGRHRIVHTWLTQHDTDTRKYCAQYRETDLDFVERLLQFEGIYYTFAEDGTLVLADNTLIAPSVDGEGTYRLFDSAGMLQSAELGIHEFRRGAAVKSGSATVHDWNWKKPNVPLRQTASDLADPELEIYDFPTGYRRPDQADRLSVLRMQALRVGARYTDGRGNIATFEPARRFVFEGTPGFEGDYLITRVEHHVINPAFGEREEHADQTTYHNRFTAIPASVPFRPRLRTKRPTVAGCHTAMVRGPNGSEIHTDRYGRFRVQMHWDRYALGTDDDSRWLRVIQESTTSMQIARVAWEYGVAYIDGDPDRPIGIARHINGEMTPTYDQPSHMNRMSIMTPTSPKTGGYNEIRMDDTAGAMQWDLKAEKDYITIVQNNRAETIGNNETHAVGQSLARQIENDQDVSIGNDQKTEVGKDRSFRVDGNRDLSIGGNVNLDIKESSSEQVNGDETVDIGGNRNSETGKDEQGCITREAVEDIERKVGAALTVKSEENIQILVQKDFDETIGGDKTIIAQEGSISQVVSGPMTVTVGADVTRKSTKDMGISAPIQVINVGGKADFTSDKKVEIRGDDILLEAKTRITFKQGDLEITLMPDITKLKGKMRIEAATSITHTGMKENLTK